MSSVTKIAYMQVYLGSWINWDYGPFLGATLTLSTSSGTLLIAFLALFVAWTGTQLWMLICYALHQRRSTSELRDALHHQQQVLLRLGISDVDFLWRVVKSTWSWKKKPASKIASRQTPLIAIALTHCALIFAASILTSRLADSTGEVLLQSRICGWPDMKILQMAQAKLTTLHGADAFYMASESLYSVAREYSRECYTQTVLLDSPGCHGFVKPTIDSPVRLDDPCPFQDAMCDTSALTIDTGLLDSHADMGVNAPPSKRVQFRKVLSCAVIPADRDYSSEWTTNSTAPIFTWDAQGSGEGVGYKYYNLGTQTILGIERPSTFWLTNLTGSYEQTYRMFGFGSFINDPVLTGFRPIPSLNRTDADVTLIVVRNRALYINPVYDPFFMSTKHRADATAAFFTSDVEAGVIGCTEQYAFCNGQARCTTLNALGAFTVESVAKDLGYNAAQRALFDMVWRTAYSMRIFNILFMLEGDVLLAQDLIYGGFGISSGLPDNQWQREIQSLHNISMAAMQQSAIGHSSPPNLDVGSGVDASHLFDWIVRENSSEQQQICQNQKVKASNCYSFNIPSLCLLLVIGLIVIVLGSTAPSLTDHWRRRAYRKMHRSSTSTFKFPDTDLSSYRSKEWVHSDPLHLHRIALEGHGIAPWTEDGSIPAPVDGQKLFRIPWLTDWPGKTFFIDRISIVV